jgi:hypothetical protein
MILMDFVLLVKLAIFFTLLGVAVLCVMMNFVMFLIRIIGVLSAFHHIYLLVTHAVLKNVLKENALLLLSMACVLNVWLGMD